MLQNASVYYDVITPLYSTLVCLCRFLSPQTVSVDWKVLPLLNVDLVWMESGFGAHTHTHLSKCVPYIFLAYGINFLTSITRSFKMIFAVRYLEHCTLVRFRLDSIRFDSIWLRAQQQGECGEISTMANAILLLLILFSIIGVCYWCCCFSKSVTFNNNRSTVHKTWYERNTYAVRSSFNSQVTNILMV